MGKARLEEFRRIARPAPEIDNAAGVCRRKPRDKIRRRTAALVVEPKVEFR